jgi:putative nucleotidyltransferase with HDIG domain
MAGTVRTLHQAIATRPRQSAAETAALVDRLVAEFLGDRDVAIHSMAARSGAQEIYLHALNVAVLSLLVAREMKLPAAQASLLGQGALFHDLGLQDVPARILRNPDPLTAAERASRALHCEHGFQRAQPLGLAPEILDIVIHHHEMADGSGFPHRLKGDAIAPLTRIAALVNQYDNLCNPANGARALTPHESLSWMFAQQKTKFDAGVMQVLIKSLGVYPPGTLVSLSNDAVCLVTAVNSRRPMKPTVVVYDAKVPSHEPIVLDLAEEPGLNVGHALKPAQVGREILDYLGVRSRVSYYFDASEGAGDPAP